MFNFPQILFNAEAGGGAAAGGTSAPGAASADPGGAGAGGSQPPPASSPAAAGDKGQQAGAQQPGSQAAGAEGPYRVDGLPDNLFGKTDRETIDAMAAALKGYRTKDAERVVPDDPAGYLALDKADPQVAEVLKPHFEGFAGDELFKEVGAAAKELGISQAQFQGLLAKTIGKGTELGLFEPPLDKAAERAALLPEAAKSLPKAEQDAAIDRRMRDNIAWLDAMVEQGLPKESRDYLDVMLSDSARGHQAFEFFRGRIEGASRPTPQAGGSGTGTHTAEGLTARQALPENTPGHPKFSRASYDQLQSDYQAFYGANGST